MKRSSQKVIILAFSTVLTGSLAVAQSSSASSAAAQAPAADQGSLGDYARKVHKDPAAKAKPKVFDNDNLPTNDKLSIVGDTTASNATDNSGGGVASTAPAEIKGGADAKPSGEAAGAPAVSPEEERAKKQAEWKTWQDKISSQRNANELAARELDVLQKEYQLRAAAMYADVGNRLRNSTQWDKEEADYKQKITDKQKAVDDGKQKFDDMQEDARKAGVPAAMRE